jgi:hypothetical protein
MLKVVALWTTEVAPAAQSGHRPHAPATDREWTRDEPLPIQLPPTARAQVAQPRRRRGRHEQRLRRDDDRDVGVVDHGTAPLERSSSITSRSIASRALTLSGRTIG